MKAAVLYEVNKPLQIEEISIQKPGPREVLIRTTVAGLCHSDLHFMEGLYPHPLPVVLGHESAGIVEQVGSDVTYVKPGDHVVTCLSVFCGTCDYCSTGRPVLCTDTTVKMLPGQSNRLSWARSEKLNQFLNLSSFAEQMLVHENAIVKIRKDMPLELAALIGCGVITGYGAVVNTAKVSPGRSAAVVGLGGVGLNSLMGLVASGAFPIIAADVLPSKLELAKSLGATHTVLANDKNAITQVRDLTKGGVDFAFEMAGSMPAMEFAYAITARGGTTISAGLPRPEAAIAYPHAAMVQEERTIKGSYMGSCIARRDIPRFLDLYMAGKLPVDKLHAGDLKFEGLNEGFDKLADGSVVRQTLRPN